MTKTKAGGSTVEDSGVSLSKEFVKQLLQQENCFKCCVQLLVESTNKRMDDLTREVQDLMNSLQFSQDQLNEFNTHVMQ